MTIIVITFQDQTKIIMTDIQGQEIDIRSQVADALAAEAGGVKLLLLDEGEVCSFWTDDGHHMFPAEVKQSFYESPDLVHVIVSQIQSVISVGEANLGRIADRIIVSMRPFSSVVLTTAEGAKTSYSTVLSVTVL